MNYKHVKIYFIISIYCFVVYYALFINRYPFSIFDQIDIILNNDSTNPLISNIFWNIRLPRLLSAILIGMSLSIAGSAYQGMFRNPLVSPDILGVSIGSSIGAIIAIYFDYSIYMVQIFSFISGILTVLTVYIIANFSKRSDPVLSLVLIGIAIGSICGAGISLIKILADPYSQLPSITFWLMGGLSSITSQDIYISIPFIIIGIVPILLIRWKINLLCLSDEESQSLGINIKKYRLILIICATLLTSISVSIAGVIGWVGLIVPHMTRLLFGSNYKLIIPLSGILGSIFLLTSDSIASSISDIELPISIVTSVIGVPFFIFLLIRRDN